MVEEKRRLHDRSFSRVTRVVERCTAFEEEPASASTRAIEPVTLSPSPSLVYVEGPSYPAVPRVLSIEDQAVNFATRGDASNRDDGLPPCTTSFQDPAGGSYDPTVPTVLLSDCQVTSVATELTNADDEKRKSPSQECCKKPTLWMWLGLIAVLIIVGGIVGAVLGTANLWGGSEASTETEESEKMFVEQMDPVLNGEAGSMYGSSLSMNTDGTRLAVGSVGYVQVFSLVNNSWAPLGPRILAPNKTSKLTDELATVIRSMTVVGLSRDGTTLVVGWPLFNGDEGELVGMAEVFTFNESAGVSGMWVRLGQELMGNAAGDLFGAAVAISERGDKVRWECIITQQ